jgi:ADP-ribosylation factor GTPase-activating protein 2/3
MISHGKSHHADQNSREEWQWDQLRRMKTGGNESATKYFQSNGGSAALSSKDPKVKYTSNAANKYKDELARRVEADKKKYPGDQIVDETADVEEEAASGAAGGDDDFFSSWDKPAVKRPSNPPSRTGTPAQRTGSPFLKPAGANGNGRPSSPLVASDSADAAPKAAAPAARSIASSAIRKTAVAGGASSKPKPNILGAKKTKLGAKKIDASALDFDEAEKKAREEAERKERLGYDPEEETAPAAKATVTATAASSGIVAPTPVSPASRDRKDSDVERLGMGVRRLGFGQVGGTGGAAPAPKKMGFGAVAKKPVEGMILEYTFLLQHQLTCPILDESEKYAREKFGAQKGISSDEFFGRNAYDSNAQSEAKTRLEGFSGATAISSNAYFGRPDDDGEGASGSGDYGDIETAAKDFVRQFGMTAGDDIENLSNLLGEGASKLGDAVRSYMNS